MAFISFLSATSAVQARNYCLEELTLIHTVLEANAAALKSHAVPGGETWPQDGGGYEVSFNKVLHVNNLDDLARSHLVAANKQGKKGREAYGTILYRVMNNAWTRTNSDGGILLIEVPQIYGRGEEIKEWISRLKALKIDVEYDDGFEAKTGDYSPQIKIVKSKKDPPKLPE